ncbi:CPBP family intramembrane glutamate endopeptidase [Rivularia sp. UHCC 0363]|uniref:CPBP family intramembrane glutamate endopeptidase n=1 Tax=Rivularia sp. UHCC 0363 TaxID=3110244 RepID=UPI002B21AA42|nr:CPBP family intramembrane glutamate endopeptidase [Rivularia sp. UHCC 0363]MEA5594523.1 CPBP family intramembrane glutamate endopeptidase [Rivularia sp. UHCC 0363]
MTNVIIFVICLITGYIVARFLTNKSTQSKPSNYKINSSSPLFHSNYYPINQTVNSQYLPVAEWSGRLILPTENKNERFVEFEVQNAPDSYLHLLGKVLKLKWSNDEKVQEYVKRVSFDVNFTKQAKKSHQAGKVHPIRLDGRSQVDPLESLAGARLIDDVCVMLLQPEVQTDAGGETHLVIKEEPVQIAGRFVGLVKIQARIELESDLFRVHHYNKAIKNFDKEREEILCIPQVPQDIQGVARSSNRDIEISPLNSQGWYIYGAPNAEGTFVVQAIEPRALVKVEPQKVIVKLQQVFEYIKYEMWSNIKLQKGNCETVLLAPNAVNAKNAVSQWQLGEKALLMHLFGGIGGRKAEAAAWLPVPGHFSYGIAEVVRDRITSELRFDIVYYQVYCHNPEAVISGSLTWAAYMGSLWRGWLGTRPVSDILVKYEPITTDYNFDGIKLSPLTEFIEELREITARYRVGDGTGASLITPTASCVQDSNQALYSTIYDIQRLVKSNPKISEWLEKHPKDKQTQYFNELISLGNILEKQLIPLGIVRRDWQKNAKDLFGTNNKNDNIITTATKMLRSWRTVLPKRAQDETTKIFLKQGATAWVLRTNQVGGFDDAILPVAPTTIFR